MVTANLSGGVSTTVLVDSGAFDHVEPSDEEVTLRDKNGVEYVGKVTGGTFSSIAVVIERNEITALSPNARIEADYGGATIPATVRRAYKRPDGKWIVTLRWG